MLTIHHLTIAFGPTTAVRDLTLHARTGTITGILGANGAGKTTTLLGIHHRVPRHTGHITLDGHDVTQHDTTALVRAGIALCPENRRLFPNMTIEDNLLLGAYGQGRATRRARLERAYERFPWLRERRNEAAGRLSGGQQQTVAIARALMSEPRLILLDEPSSGLSPVAVDEIGQVLHDIAADGTTMLLVEQNVRLVEKLCTTAYILAHGQITAHGPVTQLLSTDTVSNAYLGPAG
ncbi:ABC transporter ATP-binding protein [Streptomyces sp. NBC_01803]|uniref:ABC transporter ATP-binding protein n=1 Tax=Streptomyces sp. NBC_01803 TaxID=2975946 RepID=UPI002DD7B13B|nr:ABC transporter ATP-binding protein [Streptomyces sp. NBC_01803]WSA47297.1 ABC transporter ATP-binding protein [Streptomyces sp. NBC_01803]